MPRDHSITAEHLTRLCPSLRTLLDGEIAGGNRVLETWENWPVKETLIIMLEFPFLALPDALPEGVVINAIDDKRYWLAEYEDRARGHFLACQFEGH